MTTYDGTPGSDMFHFMDERNATIIGGAGNDTVTSSGFSHGLEIYGGDGDDLLMPTHTLKARFFPAAREMIRSLR